MYKKIFTFLFLLFLTFLIVLSNINNEKAEFAYKEIEDNGYEHIYLLFEDNNLTTNNFEDYFKYLNVLKVYPYINPIYKDKINYNYSFTRENHQYDLERFKTIYTDKLRNVGLVREANECQAKGVRINKVLVYNNLNEITKLLKKYKNIKYSLDFNGIYRNL